jgi:hypothetical protein
MFVFMLSAKKNWSMSRPSRSNSRERGGAAAQVSEDSKSQESGEEHEGGELLGEMSGKDFVSLLTKAVSAGVLHALDKHAAVPDGKQQRTKKKKGGDWWDDPRIKDLPPVARSEGNFLDTARGADGKTCTNRQEFVNVKSELVELRLWPPYPTSTKLFPEYARPLLCLVVLRWLSTCLFNQFLCDICLCLYFSYVHVQIQAIVSDRSAEERLQVEW